MNDLVVHTELGEVVGVDGKVEEDIGEDKLEGWRLYCRDRLALSPFLHKLIDLFTKL